MNLLAIALILIILFCCFDRNEHFGATSPGTLIQLTAKGPQDLYLTGPSRYMHPYYLHPGMPFWYFGHGTSPSWAPYPYPGPHRARNFWG
jgi:hypothetical protein